MKHFWRCFGEHLQRDTIPIPIYILRGILQKHTKCSEATSEPSLRTIIPSLKYEQHEDL